MTLTGRGGLRAAVVLAALAALSSTPARAQDYDTSAGWGGGYIQFAPFVESGNATPSDIGFGGTWLAVLQAEAWKFDRRVGARLGGFYSHGSVSMPLGSKRAATFGLEATALLRVAAPRETNSLNAYLIGGGGVMWFSMEDRGETIIPISGTSVIYDADEARQFAALAGAGVEILPDWQLADATVGLRIEAIDYMTFGSPFRPVGSNASEMRHNPRVTVTIFSGVSRLF
jgi:hypothetical protein